MTIARAAFVLALATVGCSSSAPPRVPKLDDYDRSCQADGDCRPLFVGASTCCDLTCPNGAVNAADADRAFSDSWRAGSCMLNEVCKELPPCAGDEAICVAGQCEIRQHPSVLSLDDYDRSCTSVLDCDAVFFTEMPCGSPHCPNAAVRATEAGRVNGDVNNLLLRSSPQSCPIPPPRAPCTGRVLCVDNLCQFVDEPQDGGADAPHDAAPDTI